ncbi:MAG: DegT/DnrJ/EryC1/StrS family aminotransferase [Bacteroidia bacterium]|nr:DegT/DnrJ/EryC1/StrS family aminotransferase [Bacteroidia bacterium]MDW8015128.1 DegT/DnrJ/EryC1/StrS family aminotransferase [Bacteroidia bacterium]
MRPLKMVDLELERRFFGPRVESAVLEVLNHTQFIRGPEVQAFAQALGEYLGGIRVIPCANGTDALQLALMVLDLRPGDAVLVPAFTYVSTAEVAALLGLKIRWVEVSLDHFNLLPEGLEEAWAPDVKAIIPVHLFGQAAPMQEILEFAQKKGIAVIEDTAQALGAEYIFPSGLHQKVGTIGDIGCTSFFPSKNLGCYGDGGAVFTFSQERAERLARIANHGQSTLYEFAEIGVNSRLDSIQAAILRVKLPYLDQMNAQRQAAAELYTLYLQDIPELQLPQRVSWSTHIFHQYTLRVLDGRRDQLKAYLSERGIPAMIYYPKPLHLQPAYASKEYPPGSFPHAERLSQEVLSLPMHPFLSEDQIAYIAETIHLFFR